MLYQLISVSKKGPEVSALIDDLLTLGAKLGILSLACHATPGAHTETSMGHCSWIEKQWLFLLTRFNFNPSMDECNR